MIGLDTNVVVRYITQDDPTQSPLAIKSIRSLTPEDPGFLSAVALAELVWVLEVSYGFTKKEVVEVLDTLLRSKELNIEQAEIVAQVVRQFDSGNTDFADCLIERISHSAGCHHTLTFDRKAAKSAGMQLVH